MRASTTLRGIGPGDVGESLRTLFGVGTLSGLTDGQLLERFKRERGLADPAESEAAFTVLVERHGPMVLAVCRAVLGDRHDAEDACQAAFLVLARSAGQVRRGDSVASWLYGVARRVALRARRQAARRRELERRRLATIKAEEPFSSPPPEPWPELYEELDRLPQPFRAAVVLCDLEGHSYEQAAGLLDCPVGTLQSRLARGRERLRRRLERRGLSTAIALIGTGAGLTTRSATAAMPAQLAASIAKAATATAGSSAIVGTVATLAGAEIRRLIVTRILTDLTVLVLTGLTATALIGMAIVGRDDDPKHQVAEVPRETDAGPIHVRVVDANGAGATGIPIEVHAWDHSQRTFPADATGRRVIPRDIIGDGAVFLARRDREFLAWATVDFMNQNGPAGTATNPITMKLLPLTHRVEGSVVDEWGKPIAGVEIQVVSLPYPTEGPIYFSVGKPNQLLAPATTDNAGRYAMMLPEGVGAALRASHPRYIGLGIGLQADSRALDPMILETAGAITGTVTDATGKPVAGAVVRAGLIEHRVRILNGGGEAVSDERGRFLVGGLEPGVYNLVFHGVPGRPTLTARAGEGLRVRAGADTSADLAIIEGRPLSGVVIDRETDRPVAGIEVGCYGPARPLSGAAVESCKTDDQGRFTFLVPPGEQYVKVQDGNPFSRLGKRRLVVPEQGEIEPIQLVRAWRTYDPFGPVQKVAIPRPQPAKAKIPEEVKVEAKAVMKGETRPSQPAAVRAQEPVKAPDPNVRPVTGRIRDLQGRPLVGVRVQANDPQPGAFPARIESAVTDREGGFVLDGLPRRPLQIILTRAGFQYQEEALPANRDQVEFTVLLKPDLRDNDQPSSQYDEPIPPGLGDRLTFVDLVPRGTDYLADGPGYGGNDLNRLPRGTHKLGETHYRIGEKMIHLQSQERPDLPRSVKGITVQARGDRLHFLHSTQGGADAEGKLIGAYVIHYADGTSEQIPIVYSRDITNWWYRAPGRELTRAKVAWTGLNDAVAQHRRPGLFVRLFTITWTNPHPEKAIASVDALSAGKQCDPFLVALTLERDR